jgi:glycosyltransferase involved in cell wall biosynthesis
MSESRIAFFLPNLSGGGAQRVAINLAIEFLRLGYQVDFVLARTEGELLRDLPMQINLVELKVSRVLFAIHGLAKYLRTIKPHAIIAAPNHTHQAVLFTKIVWRIDTRIILRIGNHVSTVRENSTKIQEKIYPFIIWLFQSFVDRFIAVSQSVADDLTKEIKISPERITVIYNPVLRDEINLRKNSNLEHPWFNDKSKPVILAVGRLVTQKDYPTLLHAFAIVRKHRSAKLVILGDGPLLGKLQELVDGLGIQNDVAFLGFDINPYRYMSRCKVFVLASAWEGFPNVLAEALACGSQAVATDCPGGSAEILTGGKFGFLCPVGDPTALAETIIQAIDKPLPVEKIKKRALEFSATASAAHYLKAMGLL